MFLHFFPCCMCHVIFSSSSVLWLLPSFYEFLLCSHILLAHKSSLIKFSVFIYRVQHSYYILSERTVRFWFLIVHNVQNTLVTNYTYISGITHRHALPQKHFMVFFLLVLTQQSTKVNILLSYFFLIILLELWMLCFLNSLE